MAHRTCVVQDCDRPSGFSNGMCKKHYTRWKRHGDPLVVLKPPAKAGAYRSILLPSHPLALADGRVRVHRQVLYDAIGAGIHHCHWCGARVEWRIGPAVRGSLVVDHVDGDRGNNDLANLVPACTRCNTQRAGHPNSAKTHCPKGHEYSAENTEIRDRGAGKTGRRCRACLKASRRV